VISITDGQIYLQPELFYAGIRPDVDPGISVSRVGGSAQIKSMKKIAGTLKLAYSQYRELAAFSQFGSDLDEDTKRRLAQGQRIVEVLKQDEHNPITVENQVIIIYAVINNLLADIELEDIKRFEAELYSYMDSVHPEIIEKILKAEDFNEELTKAIEEFKVKFKSEV
ncbi:MAG: F0F1 ATP synthase subunit alpha, partial [Peptostreptococcus sp.]|nr:F0F1 ATP synthase subunit alpha [Peptostreptococcus sp.]